MSREMPLPSILFALLLVCTAFSSASFSASAEETSRVASTSTRVSDAEAAAAEAVFSPTADRTTGDDQRGIFSPAKKFLSKFNPFQFKETQKGGYGKLGGLLLKIKSRGRGKKAVVESNKLFLRNRLRSCLNKGQTFRCCVAKFSCAPCARFGPTRSRKQDLDRRAFGLIRLKCAKCATKIARLCPATSAFPPPPPPDSPPPVPPPPSPPPSPQPPPPSPPPFPPPQFPPSPLSFLTVFVTAGTYTPGVDFSSISDANEICSSLAAAAGTFQPNRTEGIAGTFLAWLSDSNGSPLTNFINTNSTLTYYKINFAGGGVQGEFFADSFDLLTTDVNQPLNALDITENGEQIIDGENSTEVWTGTLPDGIGYTQYCGDWSNSTSENNANIGVATGNDSEWTDVDEGACDTAKRLYCFQQADV